MSLTSVLTNPWMCDAVIQGTYAQVPPPEVLTCPRYTLDSRFLSFPTNFNMQPRSWIQNAASQT